MEEFKILNFKTGAPTLCGMTIEVYDFIYGTKLNTIDCNTTQTGREARVTPFSSC